MSFYRMLLIKTLLLLLVVVVVVITANWNKSIHCMHVNQLQRLNKPIQIKSEIRKLSSRNVNKFKFKFKFINSFYQCTK